MNEEEQNRKKINQNHHEEDDKKGEKSLSHEGIVDIWTPGLQQQDQESHEWNAVKLDDDEFHSKNLSESKEKTIFEVEGNQNIKIFMGDMKWWTSFLTFCGIAIAAIIGVFVRIGFGYYKIWKIETNYTLMYCQIVGCFIMGYALKLKFYRYELSQNRMVKVLFTAVTTGLCGSITSFSSWQLQCNRNFFLQWDLSWGNVGGTYNGGRLLEWFVCMWGGVVIPLSALHLGFYLATKFHPPLPPERLNTEVMAPPSIRIQIVSELALVLLFCVTILFVVSIPALLYPNWIFLSYSAVFGVCGAYLRFLLSDLNLISPSFPYGTFIANVLGTWIASIILVISKYVVDYYRIKLQSILYGILTGFCGGLTTVSTFVKEIDTLPATEGYIYTITTHALSQVGIILILNVYTYLTVPQSSVMPPPIDMCRASHDLCHDFLNMIDCPFSDRKNLACDDPYDYDSFQGVCACGLYTTDRINLILIDSQIKSNITNSMTTVWPTNSFAVDEPTEVFDLCLTYENVCQHFLNRIDCPSHQRKIMGCDKQGLSNFIPTCACGNMITATQRIKDAIVDISLGRRYDLFPYTGYPTLSAIDFEDAYVDLCSKMMDHIQCPKVHQCMRANYIPENYSTWIGLCLCNYHVECDDLEQTYVSSTSFTPVPVPDIDSVSNLHHHHVHATPKTPYRVASPRPQVDFSVRIAKNIFDALLKPNYQLLLVRPNVTSHQPLFDLCGSYYNICTFFLQKMACPTKLRYASPCGVKYNSSTPDFQPHSGEYLFPHGRIQNATSFCRCGNMNVLDARSFELVITGILSQTVNDLYTYLPSPTAPYNLAISSDPYKQLIQPRHILPLG